MSAEQIKIDSDYLAGDLAAELEADALAFGHDAEMVLKFHGIYQQDDRDVRRTRKQQRLPLDYSCMVRASVPGGVISDAQWLALDRVADLANDKLRLTTRQGVQFHVVHKGELPSLVAGINSSLLTTLGACGDVVRNIMACPLPHPERRAVLDPLVAELARRFRPQTESYWELWVDGDKAVSAERPRLVAPDALESIDEIEPIYGSAYLPRKFKIGIAWPGDNCVDVYTHDVGLVPTLSEGVDGSLTGFVVLAGGGMGMSHNRPDDTYPLLAQPVGWASPGDVADVVEAIVTTQRDHGDRDDRSRARLKYLVEARGVEWVRGQIEARTGRPLSPPVALPRWEVHTHHGWHDINLPHGAATDEHTLALGLPVPSGTVASGLRRALRQLVADGIVRELRVTPRQDLLLVGVEPHRAGEVEHRLRAHDVALAADQSPTRNLAIACPALPTCSKALGEAERVLPEVIDQLEKVLADTGTEGLALRVNMTGCPNGCSRPYAAEVGIVGRSKRSYDVFVGGSPAGDRLARRVRADVPLDEVAELLRPILERYGRATGDAAVSFGDWVWRQDWSALEALLPEDTSRRAQRREGRAATGRGPTSNERTIR